MAIYDVTGIGNAIVDVLAPCDDQFLTDFAIEKSAMTLIDEARAQELYHAMSESTQISGGSAANTLCGLASFGSKSAFIGLVANDELGQVFEQDCRALGLTYNTPRLISGAETGRSFIFITPDGERSMNTYLGAASALSIEHIDSILISNSAVTYMEGYLFDKDPAKEAYHKAAEIAHKAGNQVSLSLSDSFCVDRHRADFQNLVKDKVDILFGNEKELSSLYEIENIDEAMQKAAETCKIVVSTRGANGVVIAVNGEAITVAASKVDKVTDATGAGDQLAAGFLYGYTNGLSLEESAGLGVKAAAEVITHVGPRPLISYKDFLTA
jgi:sugar/nucleoside kinase (ribokinase family)